MTSNDLDKLDTQTESFIKRTSDEKVKNILKAGSVQGNVEINDKYLDEILHKKTYIWH